MTFKFPDLRGMTPEQKNRELIALREFYEKKSREDSLTPNNILIKFWAIIDRIFRWRIMLVRVRNPFYNAKDGKFSDEFLYFQEVTSMPYFTLERLLDTMIGVLQRNVLSKTNQRAEGFVFKTAEGEYEITIKKHKD